MRIIKKKSLFAVAMTGVIASQLFMQTAFAAPPTDNTRPGNGHGDNNHVHTGPPGGQSVRPGWGHGDKNHVHTGPPGQSVRADSHVNLSNSVSIFAAAGAKVMVTIINNITQIFHFGA